MGFMQFSFDFLFYNNAIPLRLQFVNSNPTFYKSWISDNYKERRFSFPTTTLPWHLCRGERTKQKMGFNAN